MSICRLCVLLLAALFFPLPVHADPHFPEYESIRGNVAFWKDIYGKYLSTRGLLHDAKNLGIVYEVLAVEGTRSYRVKPGGTIWSLCQNEFSLPLWLLRRLNTSLDLNRLKPGQTLSVPRVEAV